MIKIFRSKLLILFLFLPMLSNAASSGFGSWFKKNVADPVTDASDVVYRTATNGVETVVDAATDAVLYISEVAVDGVTRISRKINNATMDVWESTTDGLVYVGKKTWDGTKWVAGKFMDGKRWLLAEFKGNTEGTMTYSIPVALTRNGSDYLGTQIFGLTDFNNAKAQFTTFNFNTAYLDIPSNLGSGTISWWIECYSGADCGTFSILDKIPFTPGQRLSTSAASWKSQIMAMLNKTAPDDVKEAIMVFQITGYATTPEFVEIKFGFEAGMKGVK